MEIGTYATIQPEPQATVYRGPNSVAASAAITVSATGPTISTLHSGELRTIAAVMLLAAEQLERLADDPDLHGTFTFTDPAKAVAS